MSNAPETGALRRKSSLHIRDTRIAGLYDLEKTIGQGHFAVVKLAKHVFTGEMVAVKIIDKTKMDEASTSQIMKEVRCMKLVQHANIVRLYEVLDTQTKIFLILELGDYDLHDFIIKHEKGVCESLAQQYFCQIMTAIDYCHQLHVVHRDLKPENVVFFEKLGMVKLTDFGFSNSYEPGEQLNTSCGSLAYSAPEILLGDSYDAPAVDVWSLGVILYMLVCGRLPFQEANDSETLTKILDCKYSIPDVLSDECRNLIQSMLVREPQKRASLEKIVSTSWVQAGDRGLSTAIPLIVRHHLPTSAHATIIEQMVAGAIASEEDILRFLENDEYNSVTATYYLLAERVLASYREEQARELLAKHVEWDDRPDPISDNSGATTRSNINSRCRSRSNSWRARPCSILKEESEEELSSYLRSASRQSSRFYPLHDFVSSPRSASRCCSAQLSRQNSEEAMSLKSLDSDSMRPTTFYIPNSAVSTTNPTTPTSAIINRFDEVLSPIDEREGSESDLVRKNLRKIVLNEIVDDSLAGSDEHAIRKSSDSCLHAHHQLLRSASAKRLLRRNSSPSVSMFSGITRDRVSPQAVQELLDLNRLGGVRGRAASPESVRSSRSPSPPASSSGRTSPAMSTISSMSRLKVSASNVTNSGMRKLSSSPHLLGICEETEDGSEVLQSTSSRHLRTLDDRGGRANRSASTGLVHLPSRHHSVHATKSSAASLLTTPFVSKPQGITPTPSSSSSTSFVQFTPNTYSAVRSIRPRQAIVSPDILRRYDPHQRFIVRSKRSTSCSSSDASDDDDGRRLTMLSSKCASKFDEKNKKDDDDEANGGTTGKRGNSGSGTTSLTVTGKQSNNQSGIAPQSNEKRSTLNDSVLPLRPIPEMTLLDQTLTSPDCASIRDRILHTSLSTQTMIRKWTEMDSWYGTPPRDYEDRTHLHEKTPWLRCLRRTASSQDLLRESDEKATSEHGNDSGCSTTEKDGEHQCTSPQFIQQNMYNDSKFSFLNTLPMEKVDRWLQCADFVF